MKNTLVFKCTAILTGLWMGVTVSAAVYKIGEVVQNFSYPERSTGQPLHLSDFAGKIVVVEWFAHWCPFCRAAAPEIEREVIQYYQERQGADGIPVVKLGCNIQPDTGSNKSSTDSFVKTHKFPFVINDTSPARALQARFTSTSGQPSFAVINCATNVIDRETGKPIQQYELLYSRFGYGTTDQRTAQFRTAIDRVKVAPVVVSEPVALSGVQVSGGTIRFLIGGSPRAGLALEYSEDGVSWKRSSQSVPSDAQTSIEEPLSSGQRYYRVVKQ